MRASGGCESIWRMGPPISLVSVVGALLAVSLLAGCSTGHTAGSTVGAALARTHRPTVVVTHVLLGAVVKELVGNHAAVDVLIPNGTDPHEWSPSAKDIEHLMHADLVVENGLGLEGRLLSALSAARADGIDVFTAAEHVTVRHSRATDGRHADSQHADSQHADGADPHFWTDPQRMEELVAPLAAALARHGVDLTSAVARVEGELESVDSTAAAILAGVAPEHRKLVTGHDSLGYFADRYGFSVSGAVVSSFSSEAAASAGSLARLIDRVKREHVAAVFAELATPRATVAAVSQDAGVRVVQLSTHLLPPDGTYRSFMIELATHISVALR